MATERSTPDFKRSLDYHQEENRPPTTDRSTTSTGSSKENYFAQQQHHHHQHHRHSSASIDVDSSHSSLFERDHHQQQQQQHSAAISGSRVLREINGNSSLTPSSSSSTRQFYANAGKENSSTKPKLGYRNTAIENPGRQINAEEKQSSADFKPLSSERLRPIRQKTRNAVVSILEDETVSLEFLQKKNGEDFVVEVLLVSGDGIKVTQFHPNGRQGVELSDTPPALQSSTAVSYAFSALPTKLWKKYRYAEKFVRLVKMKTPKVNNLFLTTFFIGSNILTIISSVI